MAERRDAANRKAGGVADPAAGFTARPISAATFSVSIRFAPDAITSTASSPARSTIDFAICATVQPTALAASCAVRVPSGNSEMVSAWPAATSAARTRATELVASVTR